MTSFDTLPVESEIIVSIGTPKYDRRLSDKILAAFSHAYAEGATAVAAILRRALEEAERDMESPAPDRDRDRRQSAALIQADLWMEFVEARDFFRRAFAAEVPDPKDVERTRGEMMDAYKRWSYS